MTSLVPYVGLANGDEEDPDSGGPIPKQKLLNEFGVGTAMPFSVPYSGPGVSNGEELYEVLRAEGREEGPSVMQLEAMRRMDGQAQALFRLITEPIRSALTHSTIKPADGGQTECDFVDALLNTPPSNGGMQVTFKRVIAQMLLAVFDGFSAFELVYWVPKSGPLKGKVTLQKIAHRPAQTVTFLVDEKGTFEGIRQRTFFHGKTIDVKIDGENVVYYAANEEQRPFYGISYFQSAFYHYDKKVKLYYIANLAAQRAATGLRIGRMPKTASSQDKATFIRAMADMGVAQYITLPGMATEGWDVEVVQESTSFDFLAQINHHNSQMSKSLLAPWFDDAQGSGPGEQSGLIQTGGAGPKADMFEALIKSIMDEIADVINNDIIPRFIDWNFGTGKYPTFTWGNFTDEQGAAISALFNILAALAPASQGVTPEFARALEEYEAEELGLNVDYKKVEAREAQAKAQTDAAAALQAKQQQIMFNAQFPADDGSGGGGDGASGSGATAPPGGPSQPSPPPQGGQPQPSSAQQAAQGGSPTQTTAKPGADDEDTAMSSQSESVDDLLSLASQLLEDVLGLGA